jgi:hypothetical protein
MYPASWDDRTVTSFLMVIGDREALGWILTASRMAFRSAGRREVRSLEIGDELLIYTTRSAFRNPTRDRGRVIGTAHAASKVAPLDNPVRFDGRDYPVGCDLEIGQLAPFGHGVELAPLIPRLQTFNRANDAWSILLRRPLLRLTAHDSKLLVRKLDSILTFDDVCLDTKSPYARWFVD